MSEEMSHYRDDKEHVPSGERHGNSPALRPMAPAKVMPKFTLQEYITLAILILSLWQSFRTGEPIQITVPNPAPPIVSPQSPSPLVVFFGATPATAAAPAQSH